MPAQGEVGDPAHDGRGLADARPRRHAEVLVQRVGERRAGLGVEKSGGRWTFGVSHGERIVSDAAWPKAKRWQSSIQLP